jgi:hypothetical protein
MKYLVFILFIYGCTEAVADGGKSQEDKRFEELVKKTSSNIELSLQMQTQASKKQEEIVKKTVEQIVTLKEENKDLKVELNETKAKLDSVGVDTLLPFELLPISSKKGI